MALHQKGLEGGGKKARKELKVRSHFEAGRTRGVAKLNGETVGPLTEKIERHRLSPEDTQKYLGEKDLKINSRTGNARLDAVLKL